MSNAGVTLIELLITCAIIAVLLVWSIMALRPPITRIAAQELQRLYVTARNRAIVQNQTIAVVPANASHTVWNMKSIESYAHCDSGTILFTTSLPGRGLLSVAPSTAYRGEVVWTPNGSPRSCGRGLTNQTILLAAPFIQQYEVVISNLGRVNVQRHEP